MGRDADRDVRRSNDRYNGADKGYWMEGFDNRNGRGSDTTYIRNPRERSRERSGDRTLREISWTGTLSLRTTNGRSRERNDQRVRERSRTGPQSPRMKRARCVTE